MKICSKCKQKKSFNEFTKDKQKKDGYSFHCKKCKSLKDKAYYLNNAEKKKKQSKDNKIKNGTFGVYDKKAYLKQKESKKKRARDIKRRAQLAGTDTKIDTNYIKYLVDTQQECAYCGKELSLFHVDHIIPICKGGTNENSNLTLSCPKCNLSKGSKLLSEWLS